MITLARQQYFSGCCNITRQAVLMTHNVPGRVLNSALFVTGHLIAPVLAHSFCNHMGLPNFQEIQSHPSPVKYYVSFAFVAGLVVWYQLLYILTTPSWYSNDIYDL